MLISPAEPSGAVVRPSAGNPVLPRRTLLALLSAVPFWRPCSVCAQTVHVIPTGQMICGALGPVEGPITASEEDGPVLGQVQTMTALFGMPANMKVWKNQKTRLGSTILDGERVILYDGSIVAALGKNDADWTTLTFLAHEIGHHVIGHPLKKVDGAADDGKLALLELEADRFCGSAVCRMGGTEEDLIAAFDTLEPEGEGGYPSRKRRVEAARTGWHAQAAPQEAFVWEEPSENGGEAPAELVELVKNGIQWQEKRKAAFFDSYAEVGRNDDFIELERASDNVTLLIPVDGGMAYYRQMQDDDFEELMQVERTM